MHEAIEMQDIAATHDCPMLRTMERKKLIAANWKMNPPPSGWDAPDSPYRPHPSVDVVVCPPFLWLRECIGEELVVGAQCGHPEAKGTHTGCVSMAMLAEEGCAYVICGHSDRRREQKETNADVVAQAKAALKATLIPIVCIGETREERQTGKAKDVVSAQLKDLPEGIVLAYEPVWAISNGDPSTPAATSADAQEMHAFIRSQLPKSAQETTRILYGGSMKPENAAELLAQPDIDGGLVGNASLSPKDFGEIVNIAAKK